MNIVTRLVYLRRWRLARELLSLYGVEVPPNVKIGKNFNLAHRGFGTVIHPESTIGDRVTIYHQVTLGRADAHIPGPQSLMMHLVVGDDAMIFPGAKVLARGGKVLTIGRGSIIGANAVLTSSTGENEIWAGIPARKTGMRTGA